MYEEKAALHEAIKDEYFDVISEENFLVRINSPSLSCGPMHPGKDQLTLMQPMHPHEF